MQANAALKGVNEPASADLGPLAWVLVELRKSLDGATKALRRFVRDAELARGSDLAALDASQLRIARQQLHQAVGALEMVGMTAPAKVLRGMEALAQKFVQRPELCSDDAANKVERASFALAEYLEGILKGKDASPVALFPQYRDVLTLLGDERVHPADLWLFEWRWLDVVLPQEAAPLAYDSSVRARLDALILKVVKSGDVGSAKALCDICLGFASAQDGLEARVFWKIGAAYFEAVSLGLCPPDVYGKRAASRILIQYRALARGEADISERLLQDLLFFCAQAAPVSGDHAPVLAAVRAAYGLTQAKPVDYENPQFGRYDPALLVQARKRIAAATETWSALAGGDASRLKVATDQFGLVTDSILKLHPESGDLARAMTQAIETTARSGEAPPPELAMEVATAVLFLEAAYEDMDPTDSHMTQRSASLARRLEHANGGGQSEPLEAWMEELYRRVSDRQIMGSVVDELRTTLGVVEKSLDLFFRNPLDKVPLHEVPSQLAQMRGVFSVLGLDQAALASLRMRDRVDKFLVDEVDADAARKGVFEKIGNSLGTLGFLIDMLSYQRALAKKLFAYDEELGEFKPLMGREQTAQALEEPAPTRPLVQEAAKVSAVESPDDEEIDLKDIFLEEAREVVRTGLGATRDMLAAPSNMEHQSTLRRAFHTLKGSARMVGFNEFGEAAWSLEQLLNSWLAEQKPAEPALIELSDKALHGLGRWVEDIAGGADAPWQAQAFRKAADALRVDNERVDLVFAGEEVPVAMQDEAAFPDFESTQMFDFDAQDAPADADVLAPLDLMDFDFSDISAESPPEVLSPADVDLEEPVKVIGTLHIGIPLYNVYLNEADEWSRHLLTELSEWAFELHRPVADSTVGFAHSLSGSSATVGFFALSEMARALEQALRHVQLHAVGLPEHAQVFIETAEAIRHLLHQFAAGFLKEPDQALLEALKAIQETEFPIASGRVIDSQYSELTVESEMPIESVFDQMLEAAEEEAVLTPLGTSASHALTDNEEDDIDAVDALDVDLFPFFEEEALELLPQLSGALRQWTARPGNLGARNEILRVLHTLKGSARLAGAMHLGELTHRMESAIEHLGTEFLQAPQLEPLLSRFDGIAANFDALRALPEQALSLPEAGPMADQTVDSELSTAQEVSPGGALLAPPPRCPSWRR